MLEETQLNRRLFLPFYRFSLFIYRSKYKFAFQWAIVFSEISGLYQAWDRNI